MRQEQLARSVTRRVGRLFRLAFVLGIIPLLVTGCYRSFTVIDHLDIQSGWAAVPSLRLGSGDGGIFCFVSPSKSGDWSVTTWLDYDRDCPNLVLFLDVDTRGPGFDVTVGYFGLILLSAAVLTWSWWRARRARAIAAGGFEVQPSGQPDNPPMQQTPGVYTVMLTLT